MDDHRYPPYVYRDRFGLFNEERQHRFPNISEKEVIMGFPLHFRQNPAYRRESNQGWNAPTSGTLLLGILGMFVQ